jgi:hypothetical protein
MLEIRSLHTPKCLEILFQYNFNIIRRSLLQVDSRPQWDAIISVGNQGLEFRDTDCRRMVSVDKLKADEYIRGKSRSASFIQASTQS